MTKQQGAAVVVILKAMLGCFLLVGIAALVLPLSLIWGVVILVAAACVAGVGLFVKSDEPAPLPYAGVPSVGREGDEPLP